MRLKRCLWRPGVPLWHLTWGHAEIEHKGASVWVARDGWWWLAWSLQ